MTQRLPAGVRVGSGLGLLLLLSLSLSAGCYRHVVSAKGPGSAAYDISESAEENTVVISDLKPQPKPTLTKGGRPVTR